MVPHLSWSPRLCGNWVDTNRTTFLLYFAIKDWKDVLLMSDIKAASFRCAIATGTMLAVPSETADNEEELTKKIDDWLHSLLNRDIKCVYMYTQHDTNISNSNFQTASLTYLTDKTLTTAPVTMLPLITKFFESCYEDKNVDPADSP